MPLIVDDTSVKNSKRPNYHFFARITVREFGTPKTLACVRGSCYSVQISELNLELFISGDRERSFLIKSFDLSLIELFDSFFNVLCFTG